MNPFETLKPMKKDYIRIKATGLRRHQKSQILKEVVDLGWTFVEEENSEDIHTIDRRIQMKAYLENGDQNMKVHEWGPLRLLHLEVEYAGSNGLY